MKVCWFERIGLVSVHDGSCVTVLLLPDLAHV